MPRIKSLRVSGVLLLAILSVMALRPLVAADSKSADASTGKTVELFAAMESGDIEVKYIPHDSRQAQMIVKNNTDQPLTIKVPEAFAAMPVLAQQANVRPARQRNNNNNNNQNQSTGGGIGGGGGGGLGGGQFSIPPEKTMTIKAETVCLEHGKASPNPRVPYEIKPIEAYTDDPKLQELCKLLGKGQADQRVIQAAAWHFANQMTWEELANKKIHHLVGGDEQYFSSDEISAAIKVADYAIKAADARAEQTATGDKSSTTAISSGK